MWPCKSVFPRDVEDPADQFLARFIRRMRLAGKNDLDRALRVLEDRAQAIEIAQQQIGALVSCEATGKADRQRFRVE